MFSVARRGFMRGRHRQDVESAQRSERRSNLLTEDLRLFPGREVTALGGFMEVVQRGMGLPWPAFRRAIDLVREHRDRDRHFDLIGLLCRGAKVVVVIFPVEAGRGGAAVGEPVERDVVEHFVATNHAFGVAVAVAPLGDLFVGKGGQTTGRIDERVADSLRADALGRACPTTEQRKTRPSREKYEAARATLSARGIPLRSSTEQETQWQEFLSLRGGYEEALLFVARQTFKPLDGVVADIDMVERYWSDLSTCQ
jgi:hypothetical protein